MATVRWELKSLVGSLWVLSSDLCFSNCTLTTSCQNVGQCFVQRVHHVHGLVTSLLLYSLFCWSIWEPLKLRANARNIVGATLLANNSQHCVRLHVAWKSPLNVGFLKWTMLLEWTNLRKTVFQDLRYFGNLVPRLCLGGNLDLNKRFDAWGKFLTMNSR